MRETLQYAYKLAETYRLIAMQRLLIRLSFDISNLNVYLFVSVRAWVFVLLGRPGGWTDLVKTWRVGPSPLPCVLHPVGGVGVALHHIHKLITAEMQGFWAFLQP